MPTVKQIPGQMLFLLLLLLSAPPLAAERLEYVVSYQGGLTAMARLDICSVVLERSPQPVSVNGEPAYRAQLWISSEGYKKMEYLYPFRLRLTSYLSSDLRRTLLSERYRKTRKERHEITWFDWRRKVVERYKRRKPPRAALLAAPAPAREASGPFRLLGYDAAQFRRSGKAAQPLTDDLLDRLSLLQVIRARPLAVGDELRFRVAAGKKVLNYRIRVQSRGPLAEAAPGQSFFTLRFDAFKEGKWSGQPAHPAVFVWVTADARRIPARFSIDYALGVFVVQLQGLASPEQLPAERRSGASG